MLSAQPGVSEDVNGAWYKEAIAAAHLYISGCHRLSLILVRIVNTSTGAQHGVGSVPGSKVRKHEVRMGKVRKQKPLSRSSYGIKFITAKVPNVQSSHQMKFVFRKFVMDKVRVFRVHIVKFTKEKNVLEKIRRNANIHIGQAS